MVWWLLSFTVVCLSLLALRLWRRWIRPWTDLHQLVRQIGRGEKPRTFLIEGAVLPCRVGVALEDIFLRHQELAREIAQQRESRETIFSAMADGLLVADARRRVVLLNDAARRMFNLSSPVAPGEPVLEVLREPSLDRLVEKALETNSAAEIDFTAGHKNVAIRASAVPMRGESGVVVLFHDMSEAKRTDEVRREFVANVSHELRTPLSILRGYIETLLHDPDITRDELNRILRIMERHSDRLGLIANDLLTLAQLESDRPNLQVSKVNLTALVTNMARDWENRFAQKQLKVSLDLDAAVMPIHADEARLHEILYNLIDNAVKYSRTGDEIRLAAVPEDGSVVLIVSDTGPGISREDLPRIFERFYRADKSRSREVTGTGLGLSIVKHIAQLHGGAVEAASDPGKGTTIRVRLPAANAINDDPGQSRPSTENAVTQT
jgi:two-component system phosphate regulon sensor histidine kinase PhoR